MDSAEDESDATAFHAWGWGSDRRVGEARAGVRELLDRLVELLPEARRRTRASLDSRWWAGRTSASPACSTGWWGRSAPWCSKRPHPRDSVDALIDWPGHGRSGFVDTAGMRRAIRVRGVEYYSFVRAGAAIDRADAAAVLFDAAEGLTAEDRKIASASSTGRGSPAGREQVGSGGGEGPDVQAAVDDAGLLLARR